MRERRTVAEPDERVHDGRRLDHDLDPLVRQVEQEVCLDDLEPLVGERRRVDGDLRAHAPGRVSERIVGCYVLELRSVAAAERSARGGEHDGVDRLRGTALQALEERRVLAVDRQEPPSSPLQRCERQLAGCNQALLVREREIDPALERP